MLKPGDKAAMGTWRRCNPAAHSHAGMPKTADTQIGPLGALAAAAAAVGSGSALAASASIHGVAARLVARLICNSWILAAAMRASVLFSGRLIAFGAPGPPGAPALQPAAWARCGDHASLSNRKATVDSLVMDFTKSSEIAHCDLA